MLVGNAGTGKSVIVGDKLSFLDSEQYLVKNVPFNYYTTSAMLQGKLPGEVGEKGTFRSFYRIFILFNMVMMLSSLPDAISCQT